jgi:uncharacterized integral membrane protein
LYHHRFPGNVRKEILNNDSQSPFFALSRTVSETLNDLTPKGEMMKKQVLMSLICASLMTVLTSCSKEVHGMKLQWIVIPFGILLIAIIGVIVYKNYKSLAEEKQLIAEMARREKMFAEEAEKQKQRAAEKAE